MTVTRIAERTDHGSLIVTGDDRPGIVASVARVLAAHSANIVSLDQHSDNPSGGAFFQRTVFYLQDYANKVEKLEGDLHALSDDLQLTWRLRDLSVPTRVAILASKSDHCLLDLLWRYRRKQIPMEVPMVISNHLDVADDVKSFGIPFFHIPSEGADKSIAEAQLVQLLSGKVDLVVLARYMQILSSRFLNAVDAPIINIHHSFLPAFIGASPYKKAKQRGVKLVGATAHYVTAELDEGPIIEQDVVRVNHSDDILDLTRKGADVERAVLARAVLWHCEDRIIRHNTQTVVF